MKHINNQINLFILATFILLISRVIYTSNVKFIFLLWNLFLAWIPYVCSTYFLEHQSVISNLKKFIYFGLTIAFLPNAVYLVTDLIHLKPRTDIPLWYDAMLLFCFSLLGLVYSTISLVNLERIFKIYLPSKWVVAIMLCLILGSGYGVYLGRELRWNSWDAVLHPFSIIYDTIFRVLHPMKFKTAWLMTITFAGLQGVFWSMFRNFKLILNEK
jgi:uncharacterized membrane protein